MKARNTDDWKQALAAEAAEAVSGAGQAPRALLRQKNPTKKVSSPASNVTC